MKQKVELYIKTYMLKYGKFYRKKSIGKYFIILIYKHLITIYSNKSLHIVIDFDFMPKVKCIIEAQ